MEPGTPAGGGSGDGGAGAVVAGALPVSYTHLDVYKRQAHAKAVLDRLVFPRAAAQIAVQRPFLMPSLASGARQGI